MSHLGAAPSGTGSRTPFDRHWAGYAACWDQIAPPLRPGPDDLAVCADMARRAAGGRSARVLILGVTPEYVGLEWPQGSELTAVDRSQAMIELVWPGPADRAVCSDWTELPASDASADLILCDGGLNMLAYPLDQSRVLREARRVLRPGGYAVFRLYLLPDRAESVEQVVADAVDRRIGSLSAFKMRMWAAIQRSPEEGIAAADVWSAVKDIHPDVRDLFIRAGWPLEEMVTLELAQASGVRYALFGLAPARRLFVDAGFEVVDIRFPGYQHGDCCPSVVARAPL